ncbi:MAG: YncE family protein [Bacteroidota bacterium]
MRSMICGIMLLSFGLSTLFGQATPPASTMDAVHVIEGSISPKSIGFSGKGLFFAQNMMYQHTVTVYDRSFQTVKTLSDQVSLKAYRQPGYAGKHRGAPVEVAFSPDGAYAFVSNYKMYGQGFDHPVSDNCGTVKEGDPSFVYQINTKSLRIERVIKVGCVPKYVAVSPNGKFLLVSNWCSADLSVVDIAQGKEVQRVAMGRYPRGIVVDSESYYAYVAIMGGKKVARVNLQDFSVSYITQVGKTPRHLVLGPHGRYLYITLSREGNIVKYDLQRERMVGKVYSGAAARSMVMSQDGRFLYVVNYHDDTFSKVDARTMQLLETHPTRDKPIGITYDPQTGQVWVACYSGSIMIFTDRQMNDPMQDALAISP